jgi:uncharacterized membrane protein YphA (DoxX/SURF4 family)
MPTAATPIAATTTTARTPHDAARPPRRSRAARLALWALQVLLAVAFLGAGGSKLAGTPDMVQLFAAVGAGQWFRLVTGLLEIAGAVLLLVPALAGVGALLLAGIMAGAVVAHLTVLGTPAVAPAVLLAGLLIVAAARRHDLAARLGAIARRRR